MSKNILLNGVFVGDYGLNQGNLPHEVINFFKDDCDNFYVYITPYGVVKKGMDISDFSYILFVRSAGNHLIEVLGKAEIDKDSILYTKDIELTANGKIKNKNSSAAKKYLEWNIEHTAKYGGVPICDIHKSNYFDNDIHVTMKVASIVLPAKTFYITTSKPAKQLRENVYYIGDDSTNNPRIANTSMKFYCNEDEHKVMYDKLLQDVINNAELWKSDNDTGKYKDSTFEDNFFHVIRKQDSEVVFSNMFVYLFQKYPSLLRKFLKDILEIDIGNEKYLLEREKERMDIRLICDSYYIIIENKINSNINGVGNVIKYDDNGKILSQLKVYYEKAVERNNTERCDRTIKGYIFMPNHNRLDKSEYADGDKYVIIYYKKIYDFLMQELKNNHAYNTDLYFSEFVKALEKHTHEVDDEFRREILQRLKFRIDAIKN